MSKGVRGRDNSHDGEDRPEAGARVLRCAKWDYETPAVGDGAATQFAKFFRQHPGIREATTTSPWVTYVYKHLDTRPHDSFVMVCQLMCNLVTYINQMTAHMASLGGLNAPISPALQEGQLERPKDSQVEQRDISCSGTDKPGGNE